MALGPRRQQRGQAAVKLRETSKRLQTAPGKGHEFTRRREITPLHPKTLAGLGRKKGRVNALVDNMDTLAQGGWILLPLPQG